MQFFSAESRTFKLTTEMGRVKLRKLKKKLLSPQIFYDETFSYRKIPMNMYDIIYKFNNNINNAEHKIRLQKFKQKRQSKVFQFNRLKLIHKNGISKRFAKGQYLRYKMFY